MWAEQNRSTLLRCGIARLKNRIVHNFPSKEMTRFPQNTFIRIAKNDQVFRLEYNNEVIVIATDQYLSPRLDETINCIRSY
jgi:hypothetical protein